MNKGLLKIALLSVVCASMPAVFTSCKDYDDDIERLNKEVAENKSAIDNISQKVSQGGVITSVVPSADGKGIIITVDKNGKTESFTISNGENGKDADVWTIDANGYWCLNGTATSYKAIGQDGKDGLNGQDGKDGKDGIDGQDGKDGIDGQDGKDGLNGPAGATGTPGDYYKPNGEGYFDLYTWDAATGEYILKQKDAVCYATAIDHVTAVVTANDVYLSGVEGTTGVIVLAKTSALRGLVFKPDLYYNGIEAMDAATFKFSALKVNAVSADGNNSQDAPVVGDEVNMTPALVANYYLNPSSANIDDIFDLSFITEDLQYARSASSVTAKIFDRSAKNGILTVKANLQGNIQSISDNSKVTVLALRARLNEKAGANDTVITSDYAAVKASYYKDIDLSVPEDVNGVVLNNSDKANHWWTSAAEAIAAAPAIQVEWNNAEGLDLSQYIQADYTNSADRHMPWAKAVNEYGFKYEYALVGYTDGQNETSQSAHAALNPANNAIIRAQVPTTEGKAQAWGAAQNKSTIGRMPLVRVCLVDTVTASRPVAAVAYVKLEIVEEGAVAPAEAITPVNFNFNKGYTVNCSEDDINHQLKWNDIEGKILETLNMSKAVFELNYSLRMTTDGSKALQVNVAADKTISEAATKHGKVIKHPDPDAPQGTEVVEWVLGAQEVFEYFTGSTKPQTMSVTIVYDGKEGSAYARNHVAITLIWTPTPLNVNPTAAVDDASKIAELWFSYNSATSAANGGAKQETHLNVAVPGTTATNLVAANCTYVNNLLVPFVGNKIGFSGLDTQIYADYATTNTSFSFCDVENAPKKVKGMSGAEYELIVDGVTLRAKLGLQTQDIAIIDNDNNTVTYQETLFAKDILNYSGAQELAEGQTLSATIGISAVNGCDKKIALSNEKFNVRFLRPVTAIMADNATLQDGLDQGSSIEIANFLSFKDWRNYDFTSTNNYLSYYGIECVVIGILDPENGNVVVADDEDITDYVTTDLNNGKLGETKLSTVYPSVKLTYTPASSISLTSVGKLTYKNNGNVLGSSFKIQVPFVVSYKWGYVKCYLTATIKPTIGQ